MNTTTNTRGVSEAMVAELIAAGDFLAMNGTDGMVRRWERARAALSAPEPAAFTDEDRVLSAIDADPSGAALQFDEPAVQGDAEALELLAAEYERWGSSVIAKALRANGVGNNAFDYEVAIRAVKRALAPPAQPAERVPDGLKLAIAHIQKKADDYAEENCDVEWDTGATVYRYGQAGEDYHHGLLELVDELTQLAASPAPSDGGKGVDVSELRRAVAAIRVVGQRDSYDLIRRESVLDIIDQRLTAAQQAAR